MDDSGASCRRGGVYSASFCEAFALTMQHEGGFADDPVDPGGMTYMGISRINHPAWAGWQVIDDLRARSTEPTYSLHKELQNMVRSFYYRDYWQRLSGEAVADASVEVACELFDQAVNLGRRRAVEHMQQALNLLNRDQLLYPDLVEDGVLGPVTRNTLARACRRIDDRLLVKVMNHLQAAWYIALMRRYPSREKFAGWFART